MNIHSFFQIGTGCILAMILIAILQTTVPVVAFMKAENWEITENYIQADIIGYKIRDCKLVVDSQVGYITLDGIVKEVPFKFIKDTKSSKPRTLYKISFDRWEWSINSIDVNNISNVLLTIQHKCGDHLQQTTIGPFDLPK